MQGPERNEQDASHPELTEALGVLRDAYRQVEAPFVFQPPEHAVGDRREWVFRRRIFTLATGALATAAGIIMAFTVAVETPRGRVKPADVVTLAVPVPQVQTQVAKAHTTKASAEVSLAVPIWSAGWSVPGTTPTMKTKRGPSGTRARCLTSSPSLMGFSRKPSFKTPSLTLTPRRKSNAVDRTSHLDVRDSLPDYPAASCPV